MKYLTGNAAEVAQGYMAEAASFAKQALCLRAKCGSVIVQNKQVIGWGYNAPPLDDLKNRTCLNEYQLPQKNKHDRTCCVHAEWRAIIDAIKNHPQQIIGSTIYFTRVDEQGNIIKSGQPYCTVCSRLALDVGIAEFVLWQPEGIHAYQTGEYNMLSHQYTKDSRPAQTHTD